MFWNIVRWGGTVAVVIVVALAAWESSSNSTTRGKSPSGAYQSGGSSADANRYKDFKLR